MKYALGFLGGTVFSTFAVILAGGRPTVAIWLGFMLAVSIVAGTLRIAGLARVARFLNALAGSNEAPGARTRHTATSRRSEKSANDIGYQKPSKKQQLDVLADTIEEYKSRMTKPAPAAQPKQNLDFFNDSDLFGQTRPN